MAQVLGSLVYICDIHISVPPFFHINTLCLHHSHFTCSIKVRLGWSAASYITFCNHDGIKDILNNRVSVMVRIRVRVRVRVRFRGLGRRDLSRGLGLGLGLHYLQYLKHCCRCSCTPSWLQKIKLHAATVAR